jgi:hypothetical protein
MLSDRTLRPAGLRVAGPAAAALFIGAFLLLQAAPTPARADSYFERGFEDQMGRILAYEAVNLGKHILVHGVIHPYPAVHHGYGGHPSYGGYHPSMSYAYGYGDGRHHRKHWDHDRGHWGRGHGRHHHHHHHHGCGH